MELNFIKTFIEKLKDLVFSNTEEGTSFFKTCFNRLNALIGIGLITIPYTLTQAGWLSLAFRIILAMVFCYTGLLLQRCVDSNSSIKTYSDISSYALGRRGRIFISIFQFVEVYLVPTGFLILEGNNLHKLFPHVGLKAHGHTVEGKKFFIIISGLVILPTIWLKDFSMLSYVSATRLLSSMIIIFSILWVSVADGVGFSNKGKIFDIGGVPITLSLYAICFGAHPIFPNLFSSMKDKNRFSQVIDHHYISIAVIGYLMLGENVQSQVTLSLPTRKVSCQIAIYTILVTPITKFALIFSPIPVAIENRLPRKYKTKFISILLRTGLLISTLVVALGFPFFTLLVALIGSILVVIVSILLPCSCYLKISGAYRKWTFEAVMIWFIIFFWFSGRIGGYIRIHKGYSQTFMRNVLAVACNSFVQNNWTALAYVAAI
ncbi:hypothetical protein K2173_027053 [Erythroxylum novogranatense]|uniref:Amino acid transporter transmembrane domain-containing protein n=1 Tax=Erythroxylum novogranatense TaxID=1862640 RepID=A0AAV8TY19_9ROSI|nr:hypothetical protein K2173_027053 [Erythroxylum novogranatense]